MNLFFSSRMALYRRALSYFRADWSLIGAWGVLMGLSTGLGLLIAWPMAVLVDSVLSSSGQNDWIHRLFLAPLPANKVGQIAGLAAVGLLLKFMQDILSTAQTLIVNRINYSGLMRVRCDLYRKLQSLNLAYHRSQPQGDALYRLNSDTLGCQTILSGVVTTLVAAVTLVAMTAVLISRNATLTLLAFSIAPLLMAANLIFARRFNARTLECKQQDMQFMTVVQRSMSCIGLVQAFGREDEEFGNFRGTIREAIQAWWRLNREQVSYQLIVGFLFSLGGAAIFGYGGLLVHRGRLSIGDLMVFTSYLGMLWGPLCQMTGFSASIQSGACGAQRVFEILDRDSVIRDSADARCLPRQPRVLALDHVTFGYGPDHKVLKDVSVTIKPGQMVAFVGSSGVGKSTLLNLLPRFYDPLAGAVRLDGIDIRQVKVKDLRKHVALVLQDSVLLPTTIAENIAYGMPQATRKQIINAATLAGAEEFIEQLPQGYHTKVAEGGANLSGGQRQRIAIARALLTEAPFIVLDEPTSALDGSHEHLIAETLAALKGQRTIILVSHRLSTVMDCDQIFVLDDGRVIEQGNHAQLIARGGAYYQMARHQLDLADETPQAA